ncbi:glycosyltransferase family 4 protein [Marinobacter hydrocarbonoclasticus]|nr:glycosyltransferase family 4 protein [Marinobacter nauticus]
MSMPPKVLLLDLSRQIGGASSRVLGLLSQYPEGAAILGALTDSPVYLEARSRGLPVVGLGQHKADPRLFRQLVRACREHKIALIDSHNIQSQFWAHWACRYCNIPHISTLNSWYADEYRGGWRGRLYATLAKTLRPKGPLIAVSESIRQSLIRESVDTERVHLIPNAIAPADAVSLSRRQLAERHRLNPDQPWLVMVARLEHAKRADRFIEILNALPECQGILIGDGHLQPALTQQAQHTSASLLMTGALSHSETQAWMAAADILVLTSDTEGTPLVLLEGAALAKPMVATAVGGIPELFDDGHHARIVAPDTAALVEALKPMLAAPEQAAEMGLAARQRVHQRFNPQQQIAQTLSAYRAALEHPQ